MNSNCKQNNLISNLFVEGEELDVDAAVGLVDGRRGPCHAAVVVQNSLKGGVHQFSREICHDERNSNNWVSGLLEWLELLCLTPSNDE